jgi:hypothetical protein
VSVYIGTVILCARDVHKTAQAGVMHPQGHFVSISSRAFRRGETGVGTSS